ncbi:A24 family peptidase [Sphingomonas sp. KC8]|uniref:A24 family peptidase n=1 Tax=Sphingomonas sp. KC8 TaxID=1030157 RepID=UPI00024897F5|nr:prepilin peptidase [Sphingomonas sp. KC8]ARS27819.1 peptidase A24 [Sphingomonas sp. KC8]
MGTAGLIILGALAAALLYAAWGDIRTRTIPNWLNGAIAIAAPLWWLAQGLTIWPDMAIQLGIAAAVFAIFAGCFALGMMGGGDVKLLGALALWLPPLPLMRMLVVMALAGGVLTIVMIALHRARKAGGQPEIPYGVAISAAALWVMANDILTTPAA